MYRDYIMESAAKNQIGESVRHATLAAGCVIPAKAEIHFAFKCHGTYFGAQRFVFPITPDNVMNSGEKYEGEIGQNIGVIWQIMNLNRNYDRGCYYMVRFGCPSRPA